MSYVRMTHKKKTHSHQTPPCHMNAVHEITHILIGLQYCTLHNHDELGPLPVGPYFLAHSVTLAFMDLVTKK
jgi:hypothetical protein